MAVTRKQGTISDIMAQWGKIDGPIVFHGSDEINTLGKVIVSSPLAAAVKGRTDGFDDAVIDVIKQIRLLHTDKPAGDGYAYCYGCINLMLDPKQLTFMAHTRTSHAAPHNPDFVLDTFNYLNNIVMKHYLHNNIVRVIIEDLTLDTNLKPHALDGIERIYERSYPEIEVWRPETP